MILSEYLEQSGLTLDQFAAKIGRSGATVSRLARGIHRPDWRTLEAIEVATRGAVTPNDFLPPKPKKRAA